MKQLFLCAVFFCSLMLGGCFNLSPAYAPPDMPGLPADFKEGDLVELQGWKTATPFETAERGAWWSVFGDKTLNSLMEQANAANQNLAVAAANLRRAKAQIDVARAALLPGISAPLSISRGGSEHSSPSTSYSYGFNAQWEISFWNALPALEAAKAQAEGYAADFATTRLAIQAELASAYFQLRSQDGQESLYRSTVATYKKALELTQSQFRGGIVTRMDVDQAELQLANAQAQLAAIRKNRAELEHGIAALVGEIPSNFTLKNGPLAATLPTIPTGLPSSLLERRPDVAGAERNVAAANQQIGLVRASWFPSLNLGADSIAQGVWHVAPVWAWSVGPAAAMNLFDGGKRFGQSDAAWAEYEGQVAAYRQTVINAFKDVEDSLSALKHLKAEAAAQARSVKAAESALRIAMSQYKGGMTTYLQVVSSQESALSAQRRAIQIKAERLQAAVNLVKALGGGFSKNDLAMLVKTPPTLGKTPEKDEKKSQKPGK